jgi:hypothetical protein
MVLSPALNLTYPPTNQPFTSHASVLRPSDSLSRNSGKAILPPSTVNLSTLTYGDPLRSRLLEVGTTMQTFVTFTYGSSRDTTSIFYVRSTKPLRHTRTSRPRPEFIWILSFMHSSNILTSKAPSDSLLYMTPRDRMVYPSILLEKVCAMLPTSGLKLRQFVTQFC